MQDHFILILAIFPDEKDNQLMYTVNFMYLRQVMSDSTAC